MVGTCNCSFVGQAMYESARRGEPLLSQLPPETQAIAEMDVLSNCKRGGYDCK